MTTLTPTAPPASTAPPLPPAVPLSPEAIREFIAQARSQGLDPARLASQARYVLSVVPWDLESQVFFHGAGRTTYSIPAAPPDGYQVIPVYDSSTLILDQTRAEDEIATDGHGYTVRSIKSRTIVDDLLQHWSGDHISNKAGHRIGVTEISKPTPTDEELRKIRAQQVACFRWMVEQADAYHVKGLPQRITAEHRRALAYLRAEDPTKHPWFVEIGRTTADIPGGCPACSSAVPSTAYVCPTCRLNIAEHLLRRNLHADPKTMPGIHSELAYLKSQEANSSKDEEITLLKAKLAVATKQSPAGATGGIAAAGPKG